MKKLVATIVTALALVLWGPAPVLADPTTNQLCRNPAYHSMHENECDLRSGPGSRGGPDPGLIGRILRGIGGLLGGGGLL